MVKLTLSKGRTPSQTPVSETAPQLPTPLPPPQPQRRPTLKIRNSTVNPKPSQPTPQSALPQSATTLKLKGPKLKRASQTRALSIKVKGQIPPRPKGVGYDSEDSETERDPAVEQQFVLRMQPGEDADFLHKAIADRTIGLSVKDGGAEVSLRFVEKDYRRAVVNIRGRMYAAVLVDLPCIVETHKSWDRRGWWKVADVSQMLLVLGRCTGDDEARHFALPRDVSSQNLQFAHGLTPPMRWARKRRFRKRMSYQTIEHVEEEVEKLFKEDEQVERMRGKVSHRIMTRADYERVQNESQEPEDDYDEDEDADADADADADGELVDLPTNGQAFHDVEDDQDDLEADLEAAMEMDHPETQPYPAAMDVVQSPAPMLERAPTFAAASAVAEASLASTPAPETPPAEVGTEQSSDDDDEDESDEKDDDMDDDEDDDDLDVVDEDAAAKAAERAQQMEEVADLERELANAHAQLAATKNQLLRSRKMANIHALEEDLRVKRRIFDLDQDE